LATAAVAIPLLLAIIFYAPPWGWAALVAAASLLALTEYLSLAFHDRLGPRLVGSLLGLVVVGAAISAPAPGPGLAGALSALLVGALSYVVLMRRDLERALVDVGLIAIGVLYAGLLLSHFYWLRHLPNGEAWVILVIAVAMAGDSGGYFIGHAIGRHKLIPHISPGKTVEGAVGIIACSLLAAAGCKILLLRQHDWTEMLWLAFAMAVLGQIGDLSESVMKRAFGAKESGGLFPGHGGVLDRIDSLLFPVVLVYYYRLATGTAGPPAC
jgi:phosphatidate cytidylyltransferase